MKSNFFNNNFFFVFWQSWEKLRVISTEQSEWRNLLSLEKWERDLSTLLEMTKDKSNKIIFVILVRLVLIRPDVSLK